MSKKVLVMGRHGAGKTSMRAILFASFTSQETQGLHPTNDVDHENLKLLGNLMLNIWDCGGQDNFMKNYYESQRESVFQNVSVLIYVFGSVNEDELTIDKDFDHFKKTTSNLRDCSPSARVYALIHKMDIVKPSLRDDVYASFADRARSLVPDSEFESFATSIWDESLYAAWSTIVSSIIPNRKELQEQLNKFAELADIEEAVIFERSSYLVIMSTSSDSGTAQRYEKVSNIVKQFKLSCRRARTEFSSLELCQDENTCIIQEFTDSLNIMLVSRKPKMELACMLINLNSARQHFQQIYDNM